MKITSINTNGIRAAAKKGFFEWVKSENQDIICIQETKAQEQQLSAPEFTPKGYHCYYHDAVKKGYSGTAIYSKIEPKSIKMGIGWQEFDCEGRWLEVDLGALIVVSLYLPSGSAKEERQAFKYTCMERLEQEFDRLKATGKDFIICGDWNIVHKEIDIKNWKANQKNSGCLPPERAWLTKLFDEQNLVDVFRVVNQEPHNYTWWSNRGNARANNVGWRIDYHISNKNMATKATCANIYKDQWYSDHAPLTLEYDL
ncbi:MAG: exodeoxyribonuclease III [Proteobacteria bacterium]|nr:exodeoxyribonuclease III [Pseudomonadota bacterium]